MTTIDVDDVVRHAGEDELPRVDGTEDGSAVSASDGPGRLAAHDPLFVHQGFDRPIGVVVG